MKRVKRNLNRRRQPQGHKDTKELLELIQLSPAIKDVQPTSAQLKTLHACIKKVTEDLDGSAFQHGDFRRADGFCKRRDDLEIKPVSYCVTFWSCLRRSRAAYRGRTLAKALDSRLSTLDRLTRLRALPKFDPALLIEDTLEIPVQVNGKLRDVIKVPADVSQADFGSRRRKIRRR